MRRGRYLFLLTIFFGAAFFIPPTVHASECSTDKAGTRICTNTTPITDKTVRTTPSPVDGKNTYTQQGTGYTCQNYVYKDPNAGLLSGGSMLTDCTQSSGIVETCIVSGGSTTNEDCATRDAKGKLLTINQTTLDTSGSDGTGNQTNTAIDPKTGLVTTDTSSAVGTAAAAAYDAVTSSNCNSAIDAIKPWTWGDCIVRVVGGVILSISNFLLATAGVLLNWIVVKTVFQFGSLIGNSSGLLIAWGILRDIGNMLLLFGFIFMGLATILDLHSFPTKKAIPQLLLFAILMNFSLFAAEAVIDTSNALSSVMYSQANTDPCNGITSGGTVTVTSGGTITQSEDCAVNYGIAGHIMQATGLSSIFSVQVQGGMGQNAVTFIMLALFATVGAIVLFAAGIMLIVRVVILTFLMVSAPVGFAGMALPMFRGFADKWWKKLLSESFFAPVLFLLIFVSLKVTDSFTGTTADGLATKTGLAQNSLAGAVTAPGSTTMGIFLVFFIVIGFMIGSLIAAKSVGASGAGFAIKTAGSFAFGSMGFVGRRRSGAASNGLGKSVRSSAWAQRNPNMARRVATVFDKGSHASFDARTSKAVGAFAKAQKLDLGKPGKNAAKGFHGIEEAKIKERVDFEKTLKPTKEQNGAATEFKKELEDLEKAEKAWFAPMTEAIETKRQAVAEARKNGNPDILRSTRASLEVAVRSYQDAKRDKSNPFNAGVTDADLDKNGLVKKGKGRGSELQKLIKSLESQASKDKSTTVADSLAHAGLPFSISKHANHEAALKIRKGTPDGLDGALAKIKEEIDKKGKKDDHDDGHGGDDHAAPAAAHSPTTSAGGENHGGGDHGHAPTH